MHLRLLSSVSTILYIIPWAVANVEKTIFIAPDTARDTPPVPQQHPALSRLNIHSLTHHNSSLRTYVTTGPATASSSSSVATWLLLQDLNPGQRYEVRICWAATQPTAFTLDTFELAMVWDTPELITSLAEYAASREVGQVSQPAEAASQPDLASSVLFLRVLAAADYYTNDHTVMETPAPVHVDIILDAFLLNVLPMSLLPTVGYLLALLPVAWFIASWVSAWTESLARRVRDEREGKKSK